MKKMRFFIGIFVLMFLTVGCSDHKGIKNIRADDIHGISYGNSYYDAKNKMNKETVHLLVNDFNSVKLLGTSNQKIDYNHAITITFAYNDQISAQVTVDDKGIFQINGDTKNYTIHEDSKLYENALDVFHSLKRKVD